MVIIHKIEGFLLGDTVHVGDFVPELDPISDNELNLEIGLNKKNV